MIKELNLHGVSIIEVTQSGRNVHYNKTSSLQPPHHDQHRGRSPGPAAQHAAMITKFSPDGSRTRGTEQLRQRLHAVGHLPHVRGKLGRLLPAHRRDRQPEAHRRRSSPRSTATASRAPAASSGPPRSPPIRRHHFARWNAEKLGARPTARRLPQRRQHLRLGGRDRPVQPRRRRRRSVRPWAASRTRAPGWPGRRRPAARLVHGRRFAQRVHLQVRLRANWDPADATARPRGRRQVPRRRQALRREVQRRRHRRVARTALRRERHHRRRTPPTPFADQADVLVNARLAADAAGATKMDRPEWGAVNPTNGEVYMTLTNNNAHAAHARVDRRGQPALLQRPDHRRDGAARQPQRPHHPRGPRTAATSAATSFRWDIFLFGARPPPTP